MSATAGPAITTKQGISPFLSAIRDSVGGMTGINLEKLRAHIEILRYCREKKAELKELEEQARAAVEAAMGEATEGLLDDEPAIHWGSYKKRQFDQKAFKEDHPGLHEEYVKIVEYRRFEVIVDD